MYTSTCFPFRPSPWKLQSLKWIMGESHVKSYNILDSIAYEHLFLSTLKSEFKSLKRFEQMPAVIPLSGPSLQANFSTAMTLMDLPPDVVEEAWSKTPTCKRPRSMSEVDRALVTTPPPVVGPQSVACLRLKYFCSCVDREPLPSKVWYDTIDTR